MYLLLYDILILQEWENILQGYLRKMQRLNFCYAGLITTK